MNVVRSSEAVEEIDERDLVGSDEGSQDGEQLIGDAYDDLD